MEIPREVAKSQRVPEDLDSSARGPYQVPSPRRRRTAALVYLAAAALAAVAALTWLPRPLLGVAAGLLLVAAHHWASAWDLGLREPEALELAAGRVPFPVGHASAALSFAGWRSRPVWNVIMYSADEPPSRRGLVRLDGVTGTVIDAYEEAVPEPS